MHKILFILFFSYLFANEYHLCYISGEDLNKTKTKYTAILDDNTTREYASIRFLAKDYDNIAKKIYKVYTQDTKTNQQINAIEAYYLVNSKIIENYSAYSKLPFASEEDAKYYAKQYGGNIRNFDFSIYLAFRDLEKDEKNDEQKYKKMYFRGENIDKKMCNDLNITKENLYEYIKYITTTNVCGNLNNKNIQALAYYLENKNKYTKSTIQIIQVPQDAKCPVCGMYVIKYPKWVALASDNAHIHYFDGNKDFFKFILNPKQFFHTEKLDNLFVTDYYTLEKIDAKNAFFVVGSNVLGPMGHELVSFKTKESAQNFFKEHFAKKIYTFDEINQDIVYNLN